MDLNLFDISVHIQDYLDAYIRDYKHLDGTGFPAAATYSLLSISNLNATGSDIRVAIGISEAKDDLHHFGTRPANTLLPLYFGKIISDLANGFNGYVFDSEKDIKGTVISVVDKSDQYRWNLSIILRIAIPDVHSTAQSFYNDPSAQPVWVNKNALSDITNDLYGAITKF